MRIHKFEELDGTSIKELAPNTGRENTKIHKFTLEIYQSEME